MEKKKSLLQVSEQEVQSGPEAAKWLRCLAWLQRKMLLSAQAETKQRERQARPVREKQGPSTLLAVAATMTAPPEARPSEAFPSCFPCQVPSKMDSEEASGGQGMVCEGRGRSGRRFRLRTDHEQGMGGVEA